MADPILITPGQIVAAGDWDALSAQHGGIKSQQLRQPTAEERSAANKAAGALLGEGEDVDPSDPRTWYVRYETNPIYRYYFNDGTYAETRTADNGTDSAVVDYKPSPKFQQEHSPATQQRQNEPPKEEPNPNDPSRMRRWNPTSKAWEDAGPNQVEIDRRAKDQKPTTVSTNTTEPFIVQAGPDGKLITSPNPNYVGERPQHSTVKGPDGKTYVVTVDKDGNASAKAVAGLPGPTAGAFAPESGAPPIGDTTAEIVSGVKAYSGWLNGQVTLYQDTGGKQGISPTDAQAKMAQRLDMAEKFANANQQQTSNQTTLRGQDITERGQSIQDTTARRTAATGVYNQTLASFLPQIKYLAPGKGGNMAAAMQATLEGGLGYANAWGGMREAPPVGYGSFPMLDQLRAGSNVVVPPPAAPQPFNAGQGAAATEAARQAAQANAVGGTPTPGEPGGPPLTPGPVLGQAPAPPAGPPAPAVNPISAAPIPAPSVPAVSGSAAPLLKPPEMPGAGNQNPGGQALPPPAPPSADTGVQYGPPVDNVTIQGPPLAGAVVPMPVPGLPISVGVPLPGTPTQTMPRTVWNQQSGSMPGYQETGSTPGADPNITRDPNVNPNPMDPQSLMPRFVQQARYGQSFDPHTAAGDLAARLGIPPEIMQQALIGLYG